MVEKGYHSDERLKFITELIKQQVNIELEEQLKSFEQVKATQTDEGKEVQIKSSINLQLF